MSEYAVQWRDLSQYAVQWRALLDEEWHFVRRRHWKSHWQPEHKARRLYDRLRRHPSGHFPNGEYRMISRQESHT